MVIFPWIFLQEDLLQVSLLMPCLWRSSKEVTLSRETARQWHAQWGHWCLAISTQCGSPPTKNLHWASQDALRLAPKFEPLSTPTSSLHHCLQQDSDLDCHLEQLFLPQLLFTFHRNCLQKISCIPNSIVASASQWTWTDTETDKFLLKVGNGTERKTCFPWAEMQPCGEESICPVFSTSILLFLTQLPTWIRQKHKTKYIMNYNSL